jgi:hypothetical protein
MAGDPDAWSGDESLSRPASTPGPGIDRAGSPSTTMPADAISTADGLHWFG